MNAPANTATYNSVILEEAQKHLGVEEWPGAKQNPAILAFFEASGNSWVKDDETPWCAAFVNAILAILGLPTTGKLSARSFEDYGEPVALKDVLPGDIVVFWRGKRNGWQGHVGIVASMSGDQVMVLGGNQGDAVTVKPYGLSHLIGFRRATGIPAYSGQGRPTLEQGDRGPFVLDLQDQLSQLNYGVGRKDARFGDNTRRAVVQFQSDNGLKPDGIVGPKTWDAMKSALPKKPRAISEPQLRAEGSRTIQQADKAEKGVKNGAAAVGGLGVVEAALNATDRVTGAKSTLDVAQAMLVDNWPILIIIGIGVVGYFWGGKIMSSIRAIRTEDAQTGRNVQR